MAGKVASGAQTRREGKEDADLVAGAEGYVHLSDVMSRMERFLATYTHDYSQRDLRAFLAHFTPQARENGTPVSELGPGYEETFKAVPIMRYSIDVDRWTMRSEGISVQGRFEMRGAYADGRILSSGGKLEMELVPSGDTYRIRNLAYTFR